ncbi:MAG: hypothetical protein HPY82_20095 [Gammaproteobacteria bacterium]|nr:hypothetical protein [Gammaproteobacteria bacterium]
MSVVSNKCLLLILLLVTKASFATVITTPFQAPSSGEGVVDVGTLVVESSFDINGSLSPDLGIMGIELTILNESGVHAGSGKLSATDGSKKSIVDIDYAFEMPGFVVRRGPNDSFPMLLPDGQVLPMEIRVFTDTVGINNEIYYSDLGIQQLSSTQTRAFFNVAGQSQYVDLTYVVPLPAPLLLLSSGILFLLGARKIAKRTGFQPESSIPVAC